MDDEAYKILDELKLQGLDPISLNEFEKNDGHLKAAKTNRSRIEYYFTCTPSLPLFILKNSPEVDLITYLDADLFFFDSPAPIFQEMDNASIAIIGHRFPHHLKHLERSGIYNVGWLSFKKDSHGLECLNWWRDRCLEWCYDRHEDGRFADQKYLDDWPSRFKGVKVIEHKGANVAPWNLAKYSLTVLADGIWIDDQRLIFFHFHGFKRVFWHVYNPNCHCYETKVSDMHAVKRFVLWPYIAALSGASDEICTTKILGPSSLDSTHLNLRSNQSNIRFVASVFKGILTGRFVMFRD